MYYYKIGDKICCSFNGNLSYEKAEMPHLYFLNFQRLPFQVISACMPKSAMNCSNTWQIIRFARLSTGRLDRWFILSQNHRYNTFMTT